MGCWKHDDEPASSLNTEYFWNSRMTVEYITSTVHNDVIYLISFRIYCNKINIMICPYGRTRVFSLRNKIDNDWTILTADLWQKGDYKWRKPYSKNCNYNYNYTYNYNSNLNLKQDMYETITYIFSQFHSNNRCRLLRSPAWLFVRL
jgi:hypothetical protein